MISSIFNVVFYEPLYNILIFLSSIVPGHDLGIAIILLTLVVRFAFFPFSHKALHTQKKLKSLEPEMNKLKEKHKTNPEEQGRAMMALYKEHGVNPFSGIAVIFIQLPLFFALYWIARDNLASVATIAYSFVTPPAEISRLFLGLIDITSSNIFLALLAGLTYFVQAQLSIPPPAPKVEGQELSFGAEFARGMSFQTRYLIPIVITIAGFQLGAAVLLYWITTNLFTISHELIVRRKAQAIISPTA